MPQARRSIFGPEKTRVAGEVIYFPRGRPRDDADIDRRIGLAIRRLIGQFGYKPEEAKLIVEDFLSGSYGMWESEVAEVFR